MEWKPIETAPKDETILLVVNGYVTIGGVTNEPRTYCHGKRSEREIPGAYDMLDTGYDGESGCCIATHWMPLPDAPR